MPSASGTAVHSARVEVLADRVVEPLVGRAVAELVDPHVRMGRAGRRDGVEDRLHPVGGRHRVARHRDPHQHRAAVGRDQPVGVGLDHLGHASVVPANGSPGRSRLPGWRRRSPAAARHQDQLARRRASVRRRRGSGSPWPSRPWRTGPRSWSAVRTPNRSPWRPRRRPASRRLRPHGAARSNRSRRRRRPACRSSDCSVTTGRPAGGRPRAGTASR